MILLRGAPRLRDGVLKGSEWGTRGGLGLLVGAFVAVIVAFFLLLTVEVIAYAFTGRGFVGQPVAYWLLDPFCLWCLVACFAGGWLAGLSWAVHEGARNLWAPV